MRTQIWSDMPQGAGPSAWKGVAACGLVRWAVLLAAILCVHGVEAARVADLRCEYREDSLGIDTTRPRLTWILDSSERGQRQTAYQVLVANSAARLQAGGGDLWDSGRVASDQSVLVNYAGRPLTSHAQCFWKVRVWDKNGRISQWSAPAQWTMGLLEAGDWKATWIGRDSAEITEHLKGTSWTWHPGEAAPEKSAAPATNYFRRVVEIPAGRQIKRALFQYTGDNECRGWINEYDIGARNNYGMVKWNDITTRLEPGKTYVFGLTGRNLALDKPAGVVRLLTIEFKSGELIVIRTDTSWKVSDREASGWNTLGFDDSRWGTPKVLGPVGMPP